MRADYVRQTCAFLCTLVLFLPLLSVVSATGTGLLLDTSTLLVSGDMEEGVGDVNISIDVQSHDVPSIGALNMTLIEGESTIIATENVSLNLTADEITTVQFNISQLPIGQYTLNLQLYGDVGTPFANSTDNISQFVKRLAPASPAVGDSSQWQVTAVNSATGEASGNSSFRDGDSGWLHIPVSNSGEVEWNGSLGFAVDDNAFSTQNLIVPAQSTAIANFTIPQLSESDSTTLKVNLSGQITTQTIAVGPPPLARLIIQASVDNSTPALGQQVIWTLNTSNTGEVAWQGTLQCTFSNSGVLGEALDVNSGGSNSQQFSLSVRPGVLFCEAQGNARLHDDSLTNFSHNYDMDAAHFATAGSAGLAIVGDNFHVGDNLQATLIAHNGGDFLGNAKLVMSDSGGNSDGDSRQFEVGNSLQLDVTHTLQGGAGSRIISWSVVSQDGLVDDNLSGVIEIQVSPSQQLQGTVTSVDWTTSDGLVAEIQLQLSEGRSRLVQVQIGYSDGNDLVTVIDTNVELAAGHRTLSFQLGEPLAADQVWLSLSVSGWSPAALSEMNVNRSVSPPDVQPSVILGVANPAVPVNGQPATIAYTISNDGADNIAGGVLVLKIISTGEILWQGSAPLVEGTDSQSGEIGIDSWPSGNSVNLNLEWRSGNSVTFTSKSYSSKSSIISDVFEIPWAAIIYGSIAGIVISAIARFVFVWQGEDPEEKKELRLQRREARATARQEARRMGQERLSPTEKQEVACPACDMTLRVPHDYDGQARCPACTQVFPVTPVKRVEPEPGVESDVDDDVSQVVKSEDSGSLSRQQKQAAAEPAKAVKLAKVAKASEPAKAASAVKVESAKSKSAPSKQVQQKSEILVKASESSQKSAQSSGDEIRCPSCGQRLKVPYDRRPITAKCPRCEIKFSAEKQ